MIIFALIYKIFLISNLMITQGCSISEMIERFHKSINLDLYSSANDLSQATLAFHCP